MFVTVVYTVQQSCDCANIADSSTGGASEVNTEDMSGKLQFGLRSHLPFLTPTPTGRPAESKVGPTFTWPWVGE